MADLAARLGVSVPSVSSLELNDVQGRAKAATVERALEALGLARWDVVLPAAEMSAMVDRAEAIARRSAWTMGLEAQNVSDDAVSRLVQSLVAKQIASR